MQLRQPQLPRQPPRNGIGEIHLQRSSLVSTILKKAIHTPIVVLRSPPATGKTSLLDLIQVTIEQRNDENTKLVRLSIRGGLNDDAKLVECLFTEILGRRFYGEHCHQSLNENTLTLFNSLITNDTWILLDDVQLAYPNENFWNVVMKDFVEAAARHNVNNLHVVIACTYELASSHHGSYRPTTVVDNLRLTKKEAEQ